MGAWKFGFKKAQVNFLRSWVLKWLELTWMGIGVNDFANGFSIWGSLATQIYAYLLCLICQVPSHRTNFCSRGTHSKESIIINQPYVDRARVKRYLRNGKLYRIEKLSPHVPQLSEQLLSPAKQKQESHHI